jgi:hypothetical protein
MCAGVRPVTSRNRNVISSVGNSATAAAYSSAMFDTAARSAHRSCRAPSPWNSTNLSTTPWGAQRRGECQCQIGSGDPGLQPAGQVTPTTFGPESASPNTAVEDTGPRQLTRHVEGDPERRGGLGELLGHWRETAIARIGETTPRSAAPVGVSPASVTAFPAARSGPFYARR